MGIFDKLKKEDSNISFPEPPKPEQEMKPAFPEGEPPKPPEPEEIKNIENVKQEVERKEEPKPTENVEEKQEEEPKEEEAPSMEHEINVNPVLYIKLSEYKDMVNSTNKMRKDIEKAKEIISELRRIEKDEHTKLEKSEEIIKDIDRIISLFEKTMVTPVE